LFAQASRRLKQMKTTNLLNKSPYIGQTDFTMRHPFEKLFLNL